MNGDGREVSGVGRGVNGVRRGKTSSRSSGMTDYRWPGAGRAPPPWSMAVPRQQGLTWGIWGVWELAQAHGEPPPISNMDRGSPERQDAHYHSFQNSQKFAIKF